VSGRHPCRSNRCFICRNPGSKAAYGLSKPENWLPIWDSSRSNSRNNSEHGNNGRPLTLITPALRGQFSHSASNRRNPGAGLLMETSDSTVIKSDD